jgi:hypothetical protein
MRWVGSTQSRGDIPDDDAVTEIVKRLAADRQLVFEVVRVERALGSWLMTLQARRGTLVLRNVQCRVKVPDNLTEQQIYDGLRPFMDKIIGAFIDRVLAELRSGESVIEREARNAIQFEAAGAVTSVERPGRKIFEV